MNDNQVDYIIFTNKFCKICKEFSNFWREPDSYFDECNCCGTKLYLDSFKRLIQETAALEEQKEKNEHKKNR